MKRMIAIVLLAVTVLTLAACQQAPEGTTSRYITKDGETVTLLINFDEKTITAVDDVFYITAVGNNGEIIGDTPTEDRDVYHYTFDNGNITITYPNGATWWENATDTGAVGGWDGDYDTKRYISGMTLGQELTLAYQYARKNWDEVVIMGFVCLITIGVGVLGITHPELGYKLRYGLWVQNAEPTEFAITMSRIGGVICIIVSVIAFLSVLFR